MKKSLLLLLLCLLLALCGCAKSKNDSKGQSSGQSSKYIDSVIETGGSSKMEIIGDECLDGLDYTTFDLNVAVLRVEGDVFCTFSSSYDADMDGVNPKTDDYKLAENARFYTRNSHTVISRIGNTDTKVTYAEMDRDKFIASVEADDLAIMYLWLNSKNEITIAMMYGSISIWE